MRSAGALAGGALVAALWLASPAADVARGGGIEPPRAAASDPPTPEPRRTRPAPPRARRIIRASTVTQWRPGQHGYATYYAGYFDGRLTASGVPFDNEAMVAAHPSYPFGTVLRVTNLHNGHTVRVRVIDRGPARRPRASGVVIDLSQAAARALDFIDAGRAHVRLDVLRSGG